MKITDVRPILFWANTRNVLVVVVETDEGITGFGQAYAHIQATTEAVRMLAPRVIGQDATRIDHLWQLLFRGGFFPGGNILSSAVSAIDIALWDLNAKALGVPLYRLLGGRSRDRVPAYVHIGGHQTEGLVESAQAAVAQGWKFLRWGLPSHGARMEPTEAVQEAIEGMETLRAALGPRVELCLDVHARLDPSDAITLAKAIEPVRPYFLEDPIRSENINLYRHVRAKVNVPLAIGEQLHSKWEFREIIEEELTDYARIDICIAGGLSEAKKIAGWCETHYIKLATHNPLGPVSSAACAQLNFACSNVGVQEQPTKPYVLLPDVVPVQMEWKDGYILPPTRPGLGIEFDREAARRSPFQMFEVPHLQRADGGYTNW